MTRWASRSVEVEARVAAGDREHARAVIERELAAAWCLGMRDAAEILSGHDRMPALRLIRAEAAK